MLDPTRGPWSRPQARLLTAGSLVAALFVATGATATDIYHSPNDDGARGDIGLPAGGTQSVYLYVEGGPTPSAAGRACHDGAGGEVCGFDATLTALNGLALSGFVPDAGMDVVFNLSAGALLLNGLDTGAPSPGPHRIGELLVNASAGGEVELTSGEVIGADLASETLGTSKLVAIPEPPELLALALGLALLAGLSHVRGGSRRGGSGAVACAVALLLGTGATCLAAHDAVAAPLILNEFNAVSSSNYLNGGNATTDGDGNSTNPPADPFFGRVAGNGGDWIELAVVGDHIDIRGWSLVICELGVCNDQLFFSSHAVWSDLRAGTILTVSEDVATDLTFSPGSGDWWMNVRANNGGPGTYITASNFPVSNDDWQLTILDDQGAPVFGPIGEHVPEDPANGCFPPQDNVNSGEIFRLEQDPTALIDPCYKTLNDYEDGVLSTFGQENAWNGGFAVQSFANLRANAPYPDRDGDQIPDDGDFSGIAGDNPCVGGSTVGCDDNCGAIQNALQADSGGPGGADGMGDVCQCGDPTGDADVTAADVLELRELRVGLRSQLSVPERCSVHSDGLCSLSDLVVLDRTVGNPSLEPGLAPTCQVAETPTDQTEYVFDPDRLTEIDIRIDAADWDDLRNQQLDVFALIFDPQCGTTWWKDPEGPFGDPYTFFASEVTVDGQTFSNVGVRKKGFLGSLSTTIPSLKVKFDEFVGGQQLNDMDRLTLNNNLQDPIHITQCLGYGLMREIGIPAPRCNFTHLTVTTLNGPVETEVVDAIFSNVESIKDPFLRRHFGSDNGRLYEGTLSDFWLGSYRNTIEPKSDEAAADTTEIDTLTTVLMDDGLTDAQRLTAIEGLVDVEAFIDFWAGEGLIGHWDGYVDNQNNFWFYVNDVDGLIHFIPWGTDDTFGPGNPLRGGDPTHAEAIVPRSVLARRLYEIPSTKAQYLARLQDLLDAIWDETAIKTEIDRMAALVSPVAGTVPGDFDTLKTWVDDHEALVEAEIGPPPAPGFSSQAGHFCIFNP